MKKALKNKRILFLCPSFFNYEKKLTATMENLGAVVDFYDERPSNSFFSKAVLRINRNLVKNQISEYYETILRETKEKSYDYILISQAEATPISFINEVRKLNPNARMVLLLWDSIANKVNTVEKLPYFDEIFSFDKRDCDKYKLTFRPLFFDDEYEELANEQTDPLYDLMFVGTVHSDRYQILKEIKQQFEEHKMNVFYYMYLPGSIMYYMKKVTTNDYKGSSIKEFSFVGMPSHELVKKLKVSKAVVDIQHPLQTGLTMRTIEMLGANKKMITTNKDIVHYDFYHPNNICVIDRKNIEIPLEFMKSDYQPIDSLIKTRYTIDYFILDLLNLTNNSHKFYKEGGVS